MAPAEYIFKTRAEFKKLTSAERHELTVKNAPLIKAALAKMESVSLHQPMGGETDVHKSMIKLYYNKAGNSGEERDFWGCMTRVQWDQKSYMIMTDHQNLPDVYYLAKDKDGKQISIRVPNKSKWEKYGSGPNSILRIPLGSNEFQNLAKSKAWVVDSAVIGSNTTATYVGFNPDTGKPVFASTEYSWNGDAKSWITHSATTKNFSCGALLVDAKSNRIVGIHQASAGPNPKSGNNNFCSPLKAMAPTQV
jgi:hypothetical protein